ncbi:hypothetical protein SAMN06295967_110139 [Belliella buryatensis]|uniref:Outer membrane protein beta-barrel domain-containing protein n=1 Tax=Belliella buryatensis TaxID=1500549 RepID=A0A239EXF1_9BACT|nr:hypothetical protein [Belliella buryatensis]SNS48504.1 hypothetical protein SAMN06295967_110139 [Belliella buryatensis]
MKKVILLVLTLGLGISLQAQQSSNPYEGMLSFGSGQFFQNGKRLKMAEVIQLTKVNEEANNLARKARTNQIMSGVMAYPGSFAIGWGLGGALAGAPIEWGWVGAGAGLIGAGILFQVAYSKNAQLVTEVYNANMPYASNYRPLQLAFGVQRNGLGLSLNF